MPTIVLTNKAAKLMKLCDLEGYKLLHDFLNASMRDSLCPAIWALRGSKPTLEGRKTKEKFHYGSFTNGTAGPSPTDQRRIQVLPHVASLAQSPT